MPLSNDELLLLSRLLDEVLELNDAESAMWLENLDERLPHIPPRVRELLRSNAPATHAPFLATLPKLTALPGEGDPAESARPLRQGDVVGPYRLLREIGQGGMSAVWSAIRVDAQINRPVALKLPHVQISHLRFAERFARERDILSRRPRN
jgi:serine/threonine protein kinase